MEIKTQTLVEVKCASSILYFLLVIEAEESFQEEICIDLVTTSNYSLSGPALHPMAHFNVSPDEI
jgi:hypothetical protein